MWKCQVPPCDVDYAPAKASALPSVKGHLDALTLLWSQFDLCCLFLSAVNMQDQNECQNMPMPCGFNSLEQGNEKPFSYMQQFPIMTSCRAEWLVQERNLSLERDSVKTNLLSYPERSVSCCITSSSFFQSNFKFSFMRLFCHYCISPSVFFSDAYMGNYYGNMKEDHNSGNSCNLNQRLLVAVCEESFSCIK